MLPVKWGLTEGIFPSFVKYFSMSKDTWYSHASATLHFSTGATAMHEVMARAGLAVGAHTERKQEKSLGKLKRLKKGSRINIQKYRVAQRQAKHKDEEQQATKGGHNIPRWCFQ